MGDDISHRPSGVPSCAKLCKALIATSLVSSSGKDRINRGTESNSCSFPSKDAGWGNNTGSVIAVERQRTNKRQEGAREGLLLSLKVLHAKPCL